MNLLSQIAADLDDLVGLVIPGEDSKEEVSRQGITQSEAESLAMEDELEDLEEVVLVSPDSFERVQNIVDNLKSGQAVIVKLEGLESAEATKIIDFVSGAIYALDGNTEKLGAKIFLFTPEKVEISYQR